MDSSLALVYLSILIVILWTIAVLVVRQVINSRKLESVISDLQPKLQKEKGAPTEYYELGSVYLRKKLYAKAIGEFNKAIKEGGDNLPEVYNALGYAYFAQEQYDLSIRHYKEAIALQPSYVTALNNLGHAYEKKTLIPQAIEMYEQAYKIDSKNDIARRRLESLRKRVA